MPGRPTAARALQASGHQYAPQRGSTDLYALALPEQLAQVSVVGIGVAGTVAPRPTATTAPPAASGSAETDREALAALYNATGREKWLSDAPLSEWNGVKTDDDGRVIKLDLSYKDLRGEIPAELGSLSNLVGLDLNGNDLSGCVPSRLEDDLLFWGYSSLGDLPFC